MLFLTLLWLHVSQQHSDNNLNFSSAHTLVIYGMTCSAHPQTQKGKQRQKSSKQECENHKAAKVQKSVQPLISLQLPDFIIVL